MIIKNIGIYAHVDAGKTTITEHLLYNVGVIRNIGRVDDGNTQTDSMELERKRGISIKAAPVSFKIGNAKINLIDTPGHSDFVAEVERSINVLDGAILVISAREGVQSHTILLFEALVKLKKPIIIFVNKIDRIGVDIKSLLADIKSNLSAKVLPIQNVYQVSKSSCCVDEILNYGHNNAIEFLAEFDDEILVSYITDTKVTKEYIDNQIIKLTKNSEIYPIVFGSALHGIGIKELINAIDLLLPNSDSNTNSEIASGVVFKIIRDKNNERKIYIRLYEGQLNVRDYINGSKITKIKKLECGKEKIDSSLVAGDIGVIYGIDNINVGDVFGHKHVYKPVSLGTPTISVEVCLLEQGQRFELLNALSLISEEDPFLQFEISEVEHAIFIKLFGEIQMEILQYRLLNGYGIAVEFKDPITIYKETPIGVGEAVMYKYGKDSPFYATVGLRVEHNRLGGGVEYVSKISTGLLPQTFQNGIKDGIDYAIKQGLKGWELNDIKITLVEGSYCSVNSTPADFRNITPMVLLEAVNKAKTKLQWPMSDFKLKVPENTIGRAISDLTKMDASFNTLETEGKFSIIQGLIPVETSRKYELELRAYTDGKGVFLTKFSHYADAPEDIDVSRVKTKVDPLNKRLYILSKRGVL